MTFSSNPELKKRGDEIFKELYGGSIADKIHEEYAKKSPDFHQMSVEWCQGGLIGRPGLDLKSRELVILAACVIDGRVQDAVVAHAYACIRAGANKREVYETILMLIWYAGAAPVSIALSTLQEFFDDDDGSMKGA
ncbi:MAG: carboxymuconolactone decarboxylase family protein [Marinicaulis sp.]|nr:carboxymuconolactone decarboxylase family protein [Marinicaulis sp.]